MGLALVVQGIAIGVAVAAAVGLVNVLCIRHTLARGVRALLARARRPPRSEATGLVASFALAASNPILVAGVALGSSLWWSLLTSLVGLARRPCPDGLVRKAERVCGVLVVAAGVFAIAFAWFHGTMTHRRRRPLE